MHGLRFLLGYNSSKNVQRQVWKNNKFHNYFTLFHYLIRWKVRYKHKLIKTNQSTTKLKSLFLSDGIEISSTVCLDRFFPRLLWNFFIKSNLVVHNLLASLFWRFWITSMFPSLISKLMFSKSVGLPYLLQIANRSRYLKQWDIWLSWLIWE